MNNSKDLAIEFFKKLDEQLLKINKSDDFKVRFLLALANGEVQLTRKSKKTKRLFKTDWLEEVENSISYLENIVFNPKKFIKREEHLVPVELARKTGKESVQHLLQNTQYIDRIDEDGRNVRPSKIQTVNKEEDLAIYENRFIKMLILKMNSFIEYRYRLITNEITGKDEDFIYAEFNSDMGDAKVRGKFEFEISRENRNEDAYKSFREFSGRVDNLRMSMSRIMSSQFMKELKHARAIVGQIQKTNILGKEVNYSTCLALWYFLSNYDSVGFDVRIEEEIIPFDEGFKDEIYHLFMHGYSMVKLNLGKKYDDKLYEPVKKIKSLEPIINKYFKEVDSDYVYEEEIRIPSKIELLNRIKEEQERLEEELLRQKELEQLALEKIKSIKKTVEQKRKQETKIKEKQKSEKELERYKEIKKEEQDNILLLVRAKEIKEKQIKDQLNFIKDKIKKLEEEKQIFRKEELSIKTKETAVELKIKKLKDEQKQIKEKLKEKDNKDEVKKNKYYELLFKINQLNSTISDLKYSKKIFLDKIDELDKKIKEERENENKLQEKFKSS